MSNTEQTTALTPALNAQSALAEMTQAGRLDKYLNSFKQGGKEICDLNTSGINSLAIAQGVSIDGVIILDEDDTQRTRSSSGYQPCRA